MNKSSNLVAGSAADAHSKQGRPRGYHRGKRETFWAVIFVAPGLLAILGLRIAPAINALIDSLYRGYPGGLREPTFNGLGNYVSLLTNEAFRETVIRTILFNLVINPLQVAVALLIAVVVTRKIPAASLWRTLVFIPATIPIVGSSIVWGIAMRPQGPLNGFILALGGDTQPFLSSPNQALASILLIASWVGIGYWMLFLISGLQAVPEEYFEAAKVDRAGPVRTFLHVTLPLMKRPLLFVLVADTVANFVLFVPIQMLTNGGPQNSTTMQMFNAYRTTYTYSNRHLGAAEVVVLTLIMLIFVALQFRLLGEGSEKNPGKA